MNKLLITGVLKKADSVKELLLKPEVQIHACTGKLAGNGVLGASQVPWDNTFSNSWDKGWGNYGK